MPDIIVSIMFCPVDGISSLYAMYSYIPQILAGFKWADDFHSLKNYLISISTSSADWMRPATPRWISALKCYLKEDPTETGDDAGNFISKDMPWWMTTCFRNIPIALDIGIPGWFRISSICFFVSGSTRVKMLVDLVAVLVIVNSLSCY